MSDMGKEQGGSASPEAQVNRAVAQAQKFQADRNKAREAMRQGDDSLMLQFIKEHPISGGSGDIIEPPKTPEVHPGAFGDAESRRQAEAAMLSSEFLSLLRMARNPRELLIAMREGLPSIEKRLVLADTTVLTYGPGIFEGRKQTLKRALDPTFIENEDLQQARLVDQVKEYPGAFPPGQEASTTRRAVVSDAEYQSIRAKLNEILGLRDDANVGEQKDEGWEIVVSVEEYLKLRRLGDDAIKKVLFENDRVTVVPARLKREEIRGQIEEIGEAAQEFDDRARLYLAYYYYNEAYSNMLKMLQLPDAYYTLTVLIFERLFNLKATREGGKPLGNSVNEAFRYLHWIGEGGVDIEEDSERRRVLYYLISNPKLAEKYGLKLDSFKGQPLLDDKGQPLERLPYKLMRGTVVGGKVVPYEGDELTKEERELQNRLLPELQKRADENFVKNGNFKRLVELASRKVFSTPQNFAESYQEVLDWIAEMIIDEKVNEELAIKMVQDYPERFKKAGKELSIEQAREIIKESAKADAKVAVELLAERLFRMMGLDGWYDYSGPTKGALGRAVSSDWGSDPQHVRTTTTKDEGNMRPRVADGAMYVEKDSKSPTKKLPEHLFKHLLAMLYTNMTKEGKLTGKSESFWVKFRDEGVEMGDLDWKNISLGSWWYAFMERITYLLRDKVGVWSVLTEPPLGKELLQTGRLREIWKSIDKGVSGVSIHKGDVQQFFADNPALLREMKAKFAQLKREGKVPSDDPREFDFEGQFVEPLKKGIMEISIIASITTSYQNNALEAMRMFGLKAEHISAEIVPNREQRWRDFVRAVKEAAPKVDTDFIREQCEAFIEEHHLHEIGKAA